jgi:ABC-type sugar transport system permease subunit
LLPASLRGRKRLDDRRVLNEIVWTFRTRTAWRDVPDRYGPWATLHTRFRRWAADGTFDRMLRAAQAKVDAAGDINWLLNAVSLTLVFTVLSSLIGQNTLGLALAALMRRASKPVRTLTGGIVVTAWVLPEVVAGFLLYAFFRCEGP